MSKLATICCVLCLVIGTSLATVKVDPKTGAVIGAQTQVTVSGLGSFGAQYAEMQTELDALYIEAYERKYDERDATEIWTRIAELNLILNGRSENGNLDEGGEGCTSAFQINTLPFCDNGNTSDNVNDYVPPVDHRCGPDPAGEPVQGSGRDVVYVYTPTASELVSVSLCGSSFDTYLHIYANGCPGSENAVQLCCNDDHAGTCPSGSGNLTSCCPALQLTGGVTYYIVVDGWNSTSAGNYQISVTREDRCGPCPPQPCVSCPENAYHSIEETCFNGYVDHTNSGCVDGGAFVEQISCNSTVCATGGRYLSPTGAPLNDVDYYLLNVDSQSESLFVHLRAEANGVWALFRLTTNELCGGDVTVFNQNFERCQDRYFGACVTPGLYVLGVLLNGAIPCGTPYIVDVTCLDCPELTGRCCYRTEEGPACANGWTRDECAVVGGLWAEGQTCDEFCCPRDLCLDAIELPGVYEFTYTENTCCWPDAPWCVGEDFCNDNNCYPASRAAVYVFTLESDATVTMTAASAGDNQIVVFTDCHDVNGSCVASADVAEPFNGSPEVLTDLFLPAGTYYVATSLYQPNSNTLPCGPITLHITSDTPLPVELLGFDAIAMDGAVKLNWSTASETNNSHFNVMCDGQLVTRVNATNSATGSSYTWTDGNLDNGRLYSYELVSVDLNGTEAVVGTESAMPSAEAGVVTDYALYQNYPNPFNPETTISFDLPQAAEVRLVVINALGQEVTELVKGMLDAGHHNVNFDGSALPSGLYFYHLTAGEFSQLRKMVLLK